MKTITLHYGYSVELYVPSNFVVNEDSVDDLSTTVLNEFSPIDMTLVGSIFEGEYHNWDLPIKYGE